MIRNPGETRVVPSVTAGPELFMVKILELREKRYYICVCKFNGLEATRQILTLKKEVP